jgi:hypothetical protein
MKEKEKAESQYFENLINTGMASCGTVFCS